MNEPIFNSVHHLPYYSSGCHQVSPSAWYSILKGTSCMYYSILKDLHYGNTASSGKFNMAYQKCKTLIEIKLHQESQ